jgi:hypothetical protein
MKNARRNVNRLSGSDDSALFAQTHFAGAFDDKVNFFLLLIVPGHLSAIRLKGNIAHRKTGGLDRARAADKILRAPAGGIGPARDFGEVCDDHDLDKSSRVEKPYRYSPPSHRGNHAAADSNALVTFDRKGPNSHLSIFSVDDDGNLTLWKLMPVRLTAS